MIFVDTGAWFALAVREDPDHRRAAAYLEGLHGPLVTSDLVAVETMNLLRFRKRGAPGLEIADRVGADLWEGRAAKLVRAGREDILRAREIFREFADKQWSFTDCTSFAIMQRLSLGSAFAFDRNFDQFPGIHRVPR
ncbi:MAG: type II toxin-antitoxin system VapC family toxin [Deltaproteobacteria bacterium]|nr:type II toxin-antitoxin system VapC family toxin [Deltaproteobacteria bacterium]